MSHHIYTTDAYIVESNLSGEADRYYILLTKDLGLIRATAKGVRLQKSKLKYSLQEYSRSSVSLVRGKEIWRITSARLVDNLYTRYKGSKDILIVIAHIMTLIKRLVGAEEKNEALFEIISQACSYLQLTPPSDVNRIKLFEILVVLKILDNLGYMGKIPELAPFIQADITEEQLVQLEKHKERALREINTSLRETQL